MENLSHGLNTIWPHNTQGSPGGISVIRYISVFSHPSLKLLHSAATVIFLFLQSRTTVQVCRTFSATFSGPSCQKYIVLCHRQHKNHRSQKVSGSVA